MPSAPKLRMVGQLPVEPASGEALLGGCQLAPGVAQLAAQRRALKAFGCNHSKWLPSMPLPA